MVGSYFFFDRFSSKEHYLGIGIWWQILARIILDGPVNVRNLLAGKYGRSSSSSAIIGGIKSCVLPLPSAQELTDSVLCHLSEVSKEKIRSQLWDGGPDHKQVVDITGTGVGYSI